MNNKPLIGILAHKHMGEHQPGYGQNEAYLAYFRQFGNVIMIDAQNEEVMPIDLLVLPGGRDVNPLLYGEKPHRFTQAPDLEYEWFMKNMFPKYMKKVETGKMAVYGICAGFQNLVVYFGGKINQHIEREQSDPRGELTDKLKIYKEEFDNIPLLKNTYNKYKDDIDYNRTNSIHHQDCTYDDVPENFKIIACDKETWGVEFILDKNLPIAAEQSHPEERDRPILSNSLIKYLLNTVKENKIIKDYNEQEKV